MPANEEYLLVHGTDKIISFDRPMQIFQRERRRVVIDSHHVDILEQYSRV